MQSDNYELTFPHPQPITNLLGAINYLGNKFNCTNELLNWATPLASKIGSIKHLEVTHFNEKLNLRKELNIILTNPLDILMNAFLINNLSSYISKNKLERHIREIANNYFYGETTILELQDAFDAWYTLLISFMFKKEYPDNVKEMIFYNYWCTCIRNLGKPDTRDKYLYLQRIGYLPLSSSTEDELKKSFGSDLLRTWWDTLEYNLETLEIPIKESSAYLITKLLLDPTTLKKLCLLNHSRYSDYVNPNLEDPILTSLVKNITISEQAIEQFVNNNKEYLTTLYDKIIVRKFSHISACDNMDYDFSVDWITCLKDSDILVEFYQKCRNELVSNPTENTTYKSIFELITSFNLDWKSVFQTAILTYVCNVEVILYSNTDALIKTWNSNTFSEVMFNIDLPYEYLYDALVISLRNDLTFLHDIEFNSTEYVELMNVFRKWAFSNTFLEEFTTNVDRKSLTINHLIQGNKLNAQNALDYLTNDHYYIMLLIDSYLRLA